MTASEQLFHLRRNRRYAFRARGLRVENLNRIRPGVTLQQTERHDSGLARNLRLSEGRDAFLENTNDSELELTDSNVLTNGVYARENGASEVLSYKAGFAVGLHVCSIEVSACDYEEVAYFLEAFRDSDQCHRSFNSSGHNRHR